MPSGSVPLAMPARSGTQAVERPRRQGRTSPQDGAQETTTRIAGPHAGDGVADGLDDAGALVAEDHRHRPRPLAPHDVQVRAADADGVHAHEDVAGPRLLDLDLGQLERPARRPEERRRRPHPPSSATSSSVVFTSARFVTA